MQDFNKNTNYMLDLYFNKWTKLHFKCYLNESSSSWLVLNLQYTNTTWLEIWWEISIFSLHFFSFFPYVLCRLYYLLVRDWTDVLGEPESVTVEELVKTVLVLVSEGLKKIICKYVSIIKNEWPFLNTLIHYGIQMFSVYLVRFSLDLYRPRTLLP